ncbi:MAG: prolyl oligopeptidase family serine peptidase [Candidatus Omnitrophica bacterium]|nr:prolyl oligopeptidase family serine peptidase [Candidatus Omnitrophota bacterium]
MLKQIVVYLFVFCGLIVFTAARCCADIVKLKNGNFFEGIVIKSDDNSVVIEVDIGTIMLAIDEIEKIEISSTQEKDILQQQWQEAKEQEVREQEAKEKEERAAPVEPPAPALSLPDKKEADPEEKIVKKTKQIQHKAARCPLNNSYYLLSVPKFQSQSEGSPLIVALHGWPDSPESFMKMWEFEGNKKKAFIACPKSISKGWKQKDVSNIFKMIEEIKSNYSIDSKKVFIAGVSFGGHFALYLGLLYPEQFKAVANVAGSIIRARKYIGPVKLSRGKKRLPILILIGEKDEQARHNYAKQTKQELAKYGYPVTYKVIPDFGHGYLSRFSRDISKWFGL